MAGLNTLPMVWSPSTFGRTEHHGHPQWLGELGVADRVRLVGIAGVGRDLPQSSGRRSSRLRHTPSKRTSRAATEAAAAGGG